jgi:2-phospho-L-lactate guanylyltransferase
MQRLTELLSSKEREVLARVLFSQSLNTLLGVSRLDGILVVSTDQGILDEATGAGVAVLAESTQQGHSASAERGVEEAVRRGADAVLLAPIDVPLATAEEYERLLDTAGRSSGSRVLIVPSEDGTGTNALVRSPPVIIQSCFGPDSFRIHSERARAQAAEVIVERPPGLVFDLDTPADLAVLGGPKCDGPVCGYLESICAFERARKLLDRGAGHS